MSGPRACSGRKHWVCSGQTSVWQYAWLVWSLDNTSRKGWPNCARIRDDAADILFRLYEGQEEFKAPNGKTYRCELKGGMPYSLATDLIQVEFMEDCSVNEMFLRPITNTGEMYYYTLVNISNMHVSGPAKDGHCYAVLSLSESLDDELFAQVQALPEIEDARRVDLT